MRKSAKETLLRRSPKVSILLLNRNGLKDTTHCLQSLLKTNYPNFELIMVDNASKDQSVKYVAEHFPHVKILQNKENLGYAGGHNTGLRSIDDKSKYVVLVQQDMKFDPNWLTELVRVAEGNPNIGACQPKILQFFNPKKFEYNGACGGFLDLYGYPILRGRVLDCIEEDVGQHDSILDVFWAGGCAIFIRKDVLKETGLLDEMFFMHFEEIDLCWRIHLRGYQILCVPSSIVYHKGAGGATKISTKMLFLKYRNNILMLLKNYSLLNLLKRLPIRMTLDACSVIKNETIPIRAYFSVLRNSRKLWQHRAYVQANVRRVSDNQIANLMVKKPIPLMYLKGYKRFRHFEKVW